MLKTGTVPRKENAGFGPMKEQNKLNLMPKDQNPMCDIGRL